MIFFQSVLACLFAFFATAGFIDFVVSIYRYCKNRKAGGKDD